jgi:hypothetical protein
VLDFCLETGLSSELVTESGLMMVMMMMMMMMVFVVSSMETVCYFALSSRMMPGAASGLPMQDSPPL